jgi:hypothetical protein
MNELPMNRKERYFTGTVFPMIVCKNNFKYFYQFLSLIDGCNDLLQLKTPNMDFQNNIEFFTEYSLLESVFREEDKNRYQNLPKTKDTLDIIVLIKKEPKILISIEAKMFDAPDGRKLKAQMDRQKVHIEYIQRQLNLTHVFQCALLPQVLAERVKNSQGPAFQGSGYQILTWNQILEEYRQFQDYNGDYFLNVLDSALDSYGDLVCRPWGASKNCEMKYSGQEIYKGAKSDSFKYRIMGRTGGLNGSLLVGDITSGKWRTQMYETSSRDKLPTKNWFYTEQFIEKIEEHVKDE